MTRRDWLLLCAGAVLRAATPPETGLISGFRDLYHLRFAEGRRAFQAWQAHHPGDPMGSAAEAASFLFEEFEHQGVLTVEFFLDDRTLLGGIKGTADPERTEAFEQSNARARQTAESILKSEPQNANALLAATMSAGLRADYTSLIEKRQVESLRHIREADSYANRLLAVDPQMGDGYMALGAANYILACLPAYKRAVLWFGGMQGDKQRGMDQLGRAARTGLYLAPYARMLLSLAMLREHRTEEAKRLVDELVAAFPESPLFTRERAKIDRM
jgi:hypothetical protein